MFHVGHTHDFGAGFEKKTHTPPYVHVHTVHVCCDILWFNHEVLVLGARQHYASSSHTVHRDLRSARDCLSSSLQPSLGHGTGLHVQYAACFSFFSFFFFFFFSALLAFGWLTRCETLKKRKRRGIRAGVLHHLQSCK